MLRNGAEEQLAYQLELKSGCELQLAVSILLPEQPDSKVLTSCRLSFLIPFEKQEPNVKSKLFLLKKQCLR